MTPIMGRDRADPFLQGLAAAERGLPAARCPFEPYSIDGELWLEGWAMAGFRKADLDAQDG